MNFRKFYNKIFKIYKFIKMVPELLTPVGQHGDDWQ